MTTKELTYDMLGITAADLYEQMGYHGAMPDAAVVSETYRIVDEVRAFLRARYCFFVTRDPLPAIFSLGKIIGHQLRGSEAYTLFICTAGMEFESYQQQLKSQGDLLRVFIADALGSVIAERCADQMETALQQSIDKLDWHHTNRFSPGYCGWHVGEQQLLFARFPSTCGVTLTDSSLMVPIKSVSGIIGIGAQVRHLDYSCGLCDFKQCFKRKTREQHLSNG